MDAAQSSTSSFYAHVPLHDALNIRVLDIQQTENSDDPVVCTLRVRPLDDKSQKYQTLSHAWARAERPVPLTVMESTLL